jgi:hypothetical protein
MLRRAVLDPGNASIDFFTSVNGSNSRATAVESAKSEGLSRQLHFALFLDVAVSSTLTIIIGARTTGPGLWLSDYLSADPESYSKFTGIYPR